MEKVEAVGAYLVLVSTAAIILSFYYLFFWNPTVQQGAERLVDPTQFHLFQLYSNATRRGQLSSQGNVIRRGSKMSKNSVSRGSTNGAVGSEIKFAGNDKEKMYEPKHRRKLVRVLTVIAYLFSVSLAAIMLSLFYVFIYNPGKSVRENPHDQLPAQIRYHRMSQGSIDMINETYLNLEREEPRALPVKAITDQIWDHSEELLENNQLYFNYSIEIGKENKTCLKKIIKSLQTA